MEWTRKDWLRLCLATGSAALLIPELAHAAGEAASSAVAVPPASESAPGLLTQASGNTLWTMVGAMLVMFMQPGFALVECGLTRAKNAANIMMKNYADFMMGRLLDQLERAGFIRRERCETDRRRTRIVCLPAGDAFVTRIVEQLDRHEQAVLASISPADMETFNNVYAAIVDGLEKHLFSDSL